MTHDKYAEFYKQNPIAGYPNWDMLGELLDEVRPEVVVEVGTYYGGWTRFIEEYTDPQTIIFSFQTPDSNKLNHLLDTNMGENNNIPDFVINQLAKDYPASWGSYTSTRDKEIPDSVKIARKNYWKELAKKCLSKKYHGFYDFNLLAENMNKNKKAVCILENSPPKFNWPIKYDLCTINLSYDLQDNIQQVNYWIKHIKKSGILCISSYGSIDELNNIFSKNYKTKIQGHGYLWIYGVSKV